MITLKWERFDKQKPAPEGAPSNNRSRDEDEADQEEAEAPQAMEDSADRAQGDMDALFANVHQMIDQLDELEVGQKRIKTEQRRQAEAFSRHQEAFSCHVDEFSCH